MIAEYADNEPITIIDLIIVLNFLFNYHVLYKNDAKLMKKKII